MFRNYLKIGLRNLRRQKGYAFINVAGLTVGLSCCFLIVLFVRHEQSFDRFHERVDRIYRLLTTSDEGERSATTASGFAPDLSEAFPEIQSAVRIAEGYRTAYLKMGAESRRVDGFALADPTVFEVFSFPLLRGDPESALVDAHSLVLTETAARSLFGDEDPMGEVVLFGDDTPLTVTGVMADVPPNSTLSFSFLGSFNVLREWAGEGALNEYTNYNYRTFFLLMPGARLAPLEAKFDAWLRERFGDGGPDGLALQPLTAIHFDTQVRFEGAPTRDVRYLYVFSLVGVLVLLIACVNFTNLATARAARRAREVGVRKAIGAGHHQLIGQFLGESVMLSGIAILLALVLVIALLPAYNALLGVSIRLGQDSLQILVILIAIGLLAGLLAGAYPAFYLSKFNPARVLKGEVASGRSGAWLRRSLIVFQFTASLALILSALTVRNQLEFMRTRDLGFDREQVIWFNAPGPLRERFDAFQQSLRQNPDILHVALSIPPGRVRTHRGYNWPGRENDGQEQGSGFWSIFAGPGYLETLGIELEEGRGFVSEADTQDTYMLNESAVRELGLEDPVGHPFRAWDRPMGRIVGVIKDFHFASLHHPIEPIVINYKPEWISSVVVRLAPGNVAGAIRHLEDQWKQFAPGYAVSYAFLDEDFDRAYRSEEQLVNRFSFFAGIAVFIACMGLFGLAAFAAEQRTKEIGVRKVMGASVPQVVVLLARDFLKLVGIALLIAAPIAYLGMGRWLDGFAYRTTMGPDVFLLAGTLALLLASATVSYQAIRAAVADPVNSLRYE